MNSRKKAATIKDVANEAGVSLGTVSKVINGKAVGDEYAKKVKDAIRKLDYHVNSYAQGLKASKTYTVAVLIPNTINPFYGTVAHYLNIALMKRGYKMYLCCTDFKPHLEQEYIDLVMQNKVDGIIGLTYSPDLVIGDDIPYVSIDRPLGPHIPCIASDNFAGGQLAAEKLSDLGCKNVLFLRIGSDINSEPNKRRAGFEYGCSSRGLNYEIMFLTDTKGDTTDDFMPFLDSRIHDGKPDFDGIFCVNDLLACIIRDHLEQKGIRVPEDVQIIGFDGIKEFGYLDNVCSTIVQPVEDIAEMCVDILIQGSLGNRNPLICLPVWFEEGGTTKRQQS